MTNPKLVNWNKIRHFVRAQLPILLVGVMVLVLSGYNNNFPEGYHIDEIKKVTFVQNGEQDFHHPVLLLQTTRLAVKFAELLGAVESRQATLEIGRWVTAIFALLAWWFSILLFRKILSNWEALLVATIAACTPIIAIHAHYLKEDIFLLAGLYATMWALVQCLDRDRPRDWLIFAISLGICLASHYKALVIGPVLLLMPLMKWHTQITWKIYGKIAGWGLLGLGVFVLINYPLLYEFSNFIEGFDREREAAVQGHFLIMRPSIYGYTFHLQKSIVPGISWFLTIPGLVGMIMYAFKLRSTRFWIYNSLLLLILLFYFAVEISPKKPPPDFMRYVIPVIPALILFGYLAVKRVVNVLGGGQLVAMAAMLALAIYPIYDTIMLTHYLTRDTRQRLEQKMSELGPRDAFHCEAYTVVPMHDTWLLAGEDWEQLRKNGKQYLVASSFAYQRYLDGMQYDRQPGYVYEYGKRYMQLFEQYPFLEIQPAYKSFAFSNPTIRIVDIRKKEER